MWLAEYKSCTRKKRPIPPSRAFVIFSPGIINYWLYCEIIGIYSVSILVDFLPPSTCPWICILNKLYNTVLIHRPFKKLPKHYIPIIKHVNTDNQWKLTTSSFNDASVFYSVIFCLLSPIPISICIPSLLQSQKFNKRNQTPDVSV